MTKKVILSGYYGFKNFGDEAILSLLIDNLSRFDTEIKVISSNPNYTKSLYQNVNTVRTFDIINIIKAISDADILISGGGSLLQDATSIKSLLYYLFIIFVALLLRKKIVIFAQGIGPIKSKFGQYLTKKILYHCNYITVRDYQSAELLEKWGIKSNLVPDPVFSIPITKTPKDKTLGIQLRYCKSMNEEFLYNLANYVIRHFKDYKIELYSLQDSIDLAICNKFKTLIDNKFSVNIYSDMSHDDVINRINNCEYLISMRFHSLVIALLSGVKSIAINYDIKIKKLAEEFNLPVIELDQNFDNLMINNQNFDDISIKLSQKQFNWDKFMSIIFE